MFEIFNLNLTMWVLILTTQGKRPLLTGRMGGASKQFHAKKKKLEKQAAEEKNNEKSKVNTFI